MSGIRFKVVRTTRRGSFPLAVLLGIVLLGPVLGWGSREKDGASAASDMGAQVFSAELLASKPLAWSLTSWHRSLTASVPSELDLARQFRLPEPRDLESARHRRLWATYYYLPSVTSIGQGIPLRDLAGRPLGPRLSRRDWCDAALQGSVEVRSGSSIDIFNFAGRSRRHTVDCSSFHQGISGRTKFRLARGRFGDGVKGFALVPYRSLAVDSRVVPHGAVVYIPAARGTSMRLPDGSMATHDGYFFSADAGSAIKGSHVDVYLGPEKKNPFRWVRSSSRRGFDAYVIRSGEELLSLSVLHGRPRG